jgi:hypothetical protein
MIPIFVARTVRMQKFVEKKAMIPTPLYEVETNLTLRYAVALMY